MGVLAQVTLLSLLLAGVAAVPLFAYRRANRFLALQRASTGAYLLLALPALLPAAAVFLWLFGAPFDGRLLWVVAVVAELIIDFGPRFAIRLTGGPRKASYRLEATVTALLRAAEARLRRGDQEGLIGELRDAEAALGGGPVAVREAIRDVIEAVGRPARSAEVRNRVALLDRAVQGQWRVPKWIGRMARVAPTVALLGVFGVNLGLGIDARRACITSEIVSGTASSNEPRPGVPVGDTIVGSPEDGAAMTVDLPLSLDLAAESRHDPDARRDLERSGFVTGHLREWWAADGRLIHADAFEFVDHEGALDYQRAVTAYGCSFADTSFGAPAGGVGLQVRYGAPDPIVEQVSWVSGNRRYLVSVGHEAPPPDHRRILAIYDSATR